MNLIVDYSKCKIFGLNYVREIKNDKGEVGGYLLIDNRNKPIKDVYDYLKYLKNKKGAALNSLKRSVYDIANFYDFMLINNLDVELIDYNILKEFIDGYLRKCDPFFRTRDCLDRCMLKGIPLHSDYKNENVKSIRQNGITDTSIARIVNCIKDYFIFLHDEKKRDIKLSKLFKCSEGKFSNSNALLGHLPIVYKSYNANGILKACNIKLARINKINPIDVECVFSKQEKEAFFYELERHSSPSYQLLFFLLSVTGMRISEALALKLFEVKKDNRSFDYRKMSSDIVLTNENEDLWKVNITIDSNDPPDLRVKNGKERSIPIVDTTGKLKSLLTNALYHREYIVRRKKKSHNYLFINRNGDRLKHDRALQHFYETIDKAGMQSRKGNGQLVIHSFRHTFASEYISKLKSKNFDIELELLSDILGHSSSSTTRKTYIHFFKDDILELLKKMEKTITQP